MGQKIHPTGFRLAVTRDWSSRWYANSKNFSTMLNEDVQVRDYLKEVEAERRKDEEERRAADVASHARILAEMTKGEETDPDSGAHPVVAGHGGRQAAGAARPSIEPR